MAKRGSDDSFDPFDDLNDDDLRGLAGDTFTDDPFAEDVPVASAAPRRGRGRRSAAIETDDDGFGLDADDLDDDDDAPAGSGVSVGSAIGGLLQMLVIGVLAALLFLAIGGGLVFGARALGVVPGGPVQFNTAGLSAIVPTQPRPTSVVQVPTNSAGQSDTQATSAPVESGPTIAPTDVPPTAIPDCDAEASADWWALQQSNYDRFNAISAETVASENNVNAFLERLRLGREYSAAVITDPCTAPAQTALLAFFDATTTRVRALANLPGTPENALPEAEAALANARASLTAALWGAGVLTDDQSPVALGIERNSGSVCGASAWLRQIEPILSEFNETAATVDVNTLPPNTVRELLTELQAQQGNAQAIIPAECAAPVAQILQDAMTARIATLTNLLRGDASAANSTAAEYERLDALYRAWVQWLTT